MLKSIHLCVNRARRVKCYRQLFGGPGLNLIIGPNGTGKSTILRAIAECPDCRRTMDHAVKRGAQIICASHPILFWEQAHFIELRRGYRKRITKAVCRIKCPEETL